MCIIEKCRTALKTGGQRVRASDDGGGNVSQLIVGVEISGPLCICSLSMRVCLHYNYVLARMRLEWRKCGGGLGAVFAL